MNARIHLFRTVRITKVVLKVNNVNTIFADIINKIDKNYMMSSVERIICLFIIRRKIFKTLKKDDFCRLKSILL